MGNILGNFINATCTSYFNLVIACILGLALFKCADGWYKRGLETPYQHTLLIFTSRGEESIGRAEDGGEMGVL
jgi:hypothetical protein